MKHLKTITILFILSLFTLISLTTCKKYPQDGKLSFETPDKRIRRQPWVLTSCLVDGIDVTNTEKLYTEDPLTYKDTIIYTLLDATLEFKYYKARNTNGQIEKNYDSYFFIKNIIKRRYAQVGAYSTYKFNNYKKQLSFGTNVPKPTKFALLYNYTNEPWTIKKLTKKDLIIETTNSTGNKVTVTFKGQY